MPEISARRKTVTVHLKEGVHFSPPVNREVTSEDVAYAMERGAEPECRQPLLRLLLRSDRRRLGGARRSDHGDHDAQQARDRLQTDRTEGPARGRGAGAAADRGGAEGIRRKVRQATSRRTTPTTRSPPARTCSRTNAAGKVLGVGYIPGKSATLVRNPNWNASTDFRPAYLNEIHIKIGGTQRGHRPAGA